MSQLRLGLARLPGVLATIVAIVVVLAPVTPAAAKRAAARHASSTSRVWFPRDVLALGYATNRGAASPSQVMQIGIGLKDPNPSGEAALERAQQNPASPEYQHFLTPAQFDSRFGVSKTTFARMLSWLRGGGATVIETAGARNYVEISATVKQVNTLFGTHGNRYSVNGTNFLANNSAPSVRRTSTSSTSSGSTRSTGRPHHSPAPTPARPRRGPRCSGCRPRRRRCRRFPARAR